MLYVSKAWKAYGPICGTKLASVYVQARYVCGLRRCAPRVCVVAASVWIWGAAGGVATMDGKQQLDLRLLATGVAHRWA